jgi:thioredoxin 1
MMNRGIIELNEGNFDRLTSKGIWVIDFWAEWCGPCKMMAPEFEAASGEFSDGINFAKLNIDDNLDLATKFDVMSIPTIIILKETDEVERLIGAKRKSEIIKAIESARNAR